MDNLYTFDLPSELIAQAPASPRDHARLLVYDRASKTIVDDYFYNICKYLPANTTVVANNTKVDNCRYLFNDVKVEIFVVEAFDDRTVRAMVRPGKMFRLGQTTELMPGVSCTTTHIDDDGIRTLELSVPRDDARLMSASHVPLPPYIAQNDTLAAEYQTIYAKQTGSLAAPTAGLHFTPELKAKVAKKFGWEEITLEVGLGTFAKLSDKNFESGSLHAEKFSLTADTYKKIITSPHITAIGTTTLRTLESIPKHVYANSKAMPRKDGIYGETSIFIRPGYEFQRVDSLVTNFHLPSTSLFLLVEAFMGSRIELERVYSHAIANKYRFYSFGDAMLIL
jgi:S-adenosylmethionine:tRNA ribosyltransferase-isomerase